MIYYHLAQMMAFHVILNQNIQEDNLMPKWAYNQTHTWGN